MIKFGKSIKTTAANRSDAMDIRNHFKIGAGSKKICSRVIFKKIFQFFIVILCVTQFSLAQAQEITEENYLKVNSAIWAEFNQEVDKLSEYFQKHPEKTDSILAVYEELEDIANKKSAEVLIKYVSVFDVPSFLVRLYRLRLYAPKDAIRSVLKTIPDNMQSLPYAKSLLYHVETEQIMEESKYFDFQATDTEGRNFTLSTLEGKNILLFYGGLHCMREEGRDDLNKIYNVTSRENFEIVVFCDVSSDLESLQQERTKYHQSLPFDYFLVSDYLLDHSLMKILYGAQATPTCFLINPKGLVIMKTKGLYYEQVLQLLNEQ